MIINKKIVLLFSVFFISLYCSEAPKSEGKEEARPKSTEPSPIPSLKHAVLFIKIQQQLEKIPDESTLKKGCRVILHRVTKLISASQDSPDMQKIIEGAYALINIMEHPDSGIHNDLAEINLMINGLAHVCQSSNRDLSPKSKKIAVLEHQNQILLEDNSKLVHSNHTLMSKLAETIDFNEMLKRGKSTLGSLSSRSASPFSAPASTLISTAMPTSVTEVPLRPTSSADSVSSPPSPHSQALLFTQTTSSK